MRAPGIEGSVQPVHSRAAAAPCPAIAVCYRLLPPAADIRATTDRAGPVNLFSHPYFHLEGLPDSNSTILDHVLTLPNA